MHLGVSRIGRANAMHAVDQASSQLSASCTHSSAPACAERTAERTLVEWWENKDVGVEHAFQITEKPAGESGSLRIEVAIAATDLQVSADKQSVHVIAPRGPALDYKALKVTDANNRILASHFEAAAGGVSIVIDDAKASYPILVDPLLTNKDPSATWEGSDAGAFGKLGWSVSTAGDVNGDGYADVLVGTNNGITPDYTNARVLLFLGSPTGLLPSSWTYGTTVGGDHPTVGQGAGDVNGDGFDDILIYDSDLDATDGLGGPSSLYLGSAMGPSVERAARMAGTLFPVGDVNHDGKADLALPGFHTSTVDIFAGTDTGISNGPSFRLAATGSRPLTLVSGDFNGDGMIDIIFADSGQINPVGGAAESAINIFYGTAAGFPGGIVAPSETRFGGSPNNGFASTLASAGDVDHDGRIDLLIGISPTPSGADFSAPPGSVDLYLGGAAGLATTRSWSVAGRGVGYYNGAVGNEVPIPSFPMASAGDVNKDGFGDVIVGAQYEPNSHGGTGKAMVFLGSAKGLAPTPALSVEQPDNPLVNPGSDTRIFVGHSVGTAGDVDGDGFDDVLIGADGYTSNPNFYRATGNSGLLCLNDCAAARQAATRIKNGSCRVLGAPIPTPDDGDGILLCSSCRADQGSDLDAACLDVALPFCVTQGSLQGQCVLGCNGDFGAVTPRACVDLEFGLCITTGDDKGHCAACDGDFQSNSAHACDTAEAPVCVLTGKQKGQCIPFVGCISDDECTLHETYCDLGAHSCLPDAPNGETLPKDPAHTQPVLDGTCTVAAGALVCISGVCDSQDKLCGARNASSCSANDQCRGGVCATDDGLCGGHNTTSCTSSSQCRSEICGSNGKCGAIDGVSCTSKDSCQSAACTNGVCGVPAPPQDAGPTPDAGPDAVAPHPVEVDEGSLEGAGCSVATRGASPTPSGFYGLIALAALAFARSSILRRKSAT